MKQLLTQFSFFVLTLASITTYGQTWDVMDYSQYPTEAQFTGTYPEQVSDSGFPDFSWEKIPRWVAARSTEALTDEQIESIANNFQLVMLEKANKQGFPTIEEGIINASTRIKEINPNVKTLFYWNTQFGYLGYESDTEYLANAWEWTKHTTDTAGNEILDLHKDYIYKYNIEVEAMREWWLAEALKMANHPIIDGVFLDKCFGAYTSVYDENGDPVNNYADMIATLNDSVPEGKIIIGNTLRNERVNGNRALMEVTDGSYLERWKQFNRDYSTRQSEAEVIEISMQMMREALLKGKIINFQTSAESETEEMPETLEEKKAFAQKQVYFPLAIFLIIAEENAYYSYTTGVNAHPTTSKDVWNTSYIKEFGYKLGAPLGDPIKNGYEYSRSYENLDVWVNIETKETRFNWNELPPIPTVTVPTNNLAISGVATHSSPESAGEASRAIDGDTNGSYGAGSTSWTSSAENAWWQVELDGTHTINEIIVFGRTDECCKDRTQDFTVSVLDANDSVTYSESFESYPDPSISFDANGVKGKTIKIQRNGTGVIFLAEVQVFAPTDTLRLIVKDSVTNEFLSDVDISFNDINYSFNQAGEIPFLIPSGSYNFTFSKQGYKTSSQTIESTKDSTITIYLSEASGFNTLLRVINANTKESVAGASISMGDTSYIANDNGIVSTKLKAGVYNYTLSSTGYITANSMLNITSDTTLTLELSKETHDLKLSIKSGSTFINLQNASITINGTVYTTNTQGQVLLNLEYGEYDYTISKDGYETKEGSIVLTEDINKVILLDEATSVLDNQSANKILIYPNPAKHKIHIETQNMSLLTYELYSISGELKLSGELNQSTKSIDISSCLSGLYFIKAICNNKVITQKIIIE